MTILSQTCLSGDPNTNNSITKIYSYCTALAFRNSCSSTIGVLLN